MEPDKIQAVYELREAAEEHGRIEAALGDRADYAARRRLLDSRLTLEAKTQHAIEVCHYCGLAHLEDEPHGHARTESIIEVDFGRRSAAPPERAENEP